MIIPLIQGARPPRSLYAFMLTTEASGWPKPHKEMVSPHNICIRQIKGGISPSTFVKRSVIRKGSFGSGGLVTYQG